jgi:hypothetical protein
MIAWHTATSVWVFCEFFPIPCFESSIYHCIVHVQAYLPIRQVFEQGPIASALQTPILPGGLFVIQTTFNLSCLNAMHERMAYFCSKICPDLRFWLGSLLRFYAPSPVSPITQACVVAFSMTRLEDCTASVPRCQSCAPDLGNFSANQHLS